MAGCVHATYNRLQLLSLYTAIGPAASVTVRVRELGLWSACRLRCFDSHWRITRPSDGLLDGAFLCKYRGNRAGRAKRRNRHASSKAADVNFGCFNVRSLENMIDVLLDIRMIGELMFCSCLKRGMIMTRSVYAGSLLMAIGSNSAHGREHEMTQCRRITAASLSSRCLAYGCRRWNLVLSQ